MRIRFGQLLARPIAERERQRAFVAVALVLLFAAGALTLIAPPRDERPASRPSVTARVPAPAPVAMPSAPASPPAATVRAGRRFLRNYLAYVYGHTRSRTFNAASTALRHRLASRTPRISPAMRRRRPHVVYLSGHRLASRSRWALTATIADGGVRYPIELVIATRPRGGAVVVALGEV